MKELKKISEPFKIRSIEVHADAKLSMPALCNYLQEMAGNSAQQLGFSIEQLIEQNVTWVLTRMQVEMITYPKWRETIHVETWPSGYDRLIATRDFLVKNMAGEIIAKASTIWMLIDIKTRRPVHVDSFLKDFPKQHKERSLYIENAEKLGKINQVEKEQAFRVRFGDLDLNNHVNNVHFVEWVLEAINPEIREHKSLEKLDIQFRAECLYGDKIISQSEQLDNHTILHYLYRVSDEKEVARAKTIWK